MFLGKVFSSAYEPMFGFVAPEVNKCHKVSGSDMVFQLINILVLHRKLQPCWSSSWLMYCCSGTAASQA